MSKSDFPKEFPCPVCSQMSRVGISKKDKPYYTCLDCGVQVFIRAADGIKRFAAFKGSELLKTIKAKGSLIFSELNLLREEIEIKTAELSKLKDELPLLGNELIENKINELSINLKKLEDEYFQQLINN